jgi:diadenylate cyclase
MSFEILKHIRWQDILDILLVAVILYWLLLLMKGTKAAKILIGLILLFIAFLLSGYIGLYTMDWLIQSFWAQIVLVLVILFQPEIRRALAQMGEASFLPSRTSAEELKSLEEIVKASVALSNRKIGALIVIERNTSLKDFIELHPTSPIHDGAVVIRGNRIVSAGCFLPLSLSSELSKTVGTRHRAAIGLSEETDAVVIIVSEETGSISTVIGNRLEKNVDRGSLRDFLTDIFTASESKKR